MKEKFVRFLEFAAVIAAIIVGILVEENLSIESMLRRNEGPVTLSMTENGLPDEYVGRPAADDIPRIEDAQTWEDTWQTSYITVEPISIVSTGLGVRHPWVDAYTSSSRRGGPRRRADVTTTSFDIFGEYGEYYLIQLPDESYILAQMSNDDARKLKAGKEITLPIGKKGPVNSQILPKIKDICQEYNVNTEGVFYCINDDWNAGHSTMMSFIRLGIIAAFTLVLGVILIMIIDKIFKVKD
ncbi:MAG: hypothetical protein HDR00_13055 [Lachnospiraceae bacterium]|nr:hypothetical protein [Lachnospiraceae bacterium]